MEKPALPASRWWRLIPIVFITYSLAYLDRANFGFGMAGGMAERSRHNPNNPNLPARFALLPGLFLFPDPRRLRRHPQRPPTDLLVPPPLGRPRHRDRHRHKRPLAHARSLSPGVIEGAVFPSMLVLLSRWFVRSERSRANSLLIFGNPVTIIWMSITSGYLVHSLGWRWMFILEGIPAIAWAFCWLYWWKINPKKRSGCRRRNRQPSKPHSATNSKPSPRSGTSSPPAAHPPYGCFA